MKTLTRTQLAAGSTTPAAHPWRATGHEAPVFADPSGRRALTIGGLGLAMAAATLAALVIVVTAAFGFANVPVPRLSHVLGARPTLTAAHRVVHHPDPPRFAALGTVRSSGRVTDPDAGVNRHAHV